MFRTFPRRFRVGNTLGFLVIQNENAANSHSGILTRLKVDGSSGIMETFLPCVMTSYVPHRSYHHHIHRAPKRPVSLPHCNDCNPAFRTLYPLVAAQCLASAHATVGAHLCSAHPGAHRFFSTQGDKDDKETTSQNISQSGQELERQKDDDKPKGIMQRFKDAYKEYGKALIGVHIVTSACWFSVFYLAAAKGLDVIPLLEYIGAGEKVIKTFQLPGVGNTAVAYLCYKIATPLRYTVTIVGTQLTVRQMRRWGYWEPVKPEDSIRALMRESRENVKDKIDDVKDNVKDKIDDVKDNVKDKIGDVKGNVKDKIGDVKYDVKDKFTEMRGDFKDKYSDWKDKQGQGIKDRMEDFKDQIQETKSDYEKKVESRHKLRSEK